MFPTKARYRSWSRLRSDNKAANQDKSVKWMHIRRSEVREISPVRLFSTDVLGTSKEVHNMSFVITAGHIFILERIFLSKFFILGNKYSQTS